MAGRSGQHFAVTGAASGIGAALCDLLLASGAEVTGLDINPGPRVSLPLDLVSEDSIAEIASALEGPIDGLANVAGLPGTWPAHAILAVNSFGPYRLTQLLSPKLKPGGSVVFVSSVTAERNDWPEERLLSMLAGSPERTRSDAILVDLDGKSVYELSKRLINMVAVLEAGRLSQKAVRVNTVSPGTVDTPILNDFRESIGTDHIEAAAKITGGHGDPRDIAVAIAFLLSPEARWINGVNLKVDGGLHGLRAAARLSDLMHEGAITCS